MMREGEPHSRVPTAQYNNSSSNSIIAMTSSQQLHHHYQQHVHQQQQQDGGEAAEVDIHYESRKRPLEDAADQGVNSKRVHTDEGQFYMKVLIPSYAAGSIIGKGGQTIVQLQKETGATIKLSKSKDFYPGTTERVALIQGSPDALNSVHDFIAEKIREMPPSPGDRGGGGGGGGGGMLGNGGAPGESDGVAGRSEGSAGPLPPQTAVSSDRMKQAKVIVPNTTAGLLIGKGGATVKWIMEQSGAWVQLSQKPEGGVLVAGGVVAAAAAVAGGPPGVALGGLQERVVTVSGEREQARRAVQLIVQKIQEDPQSGSCLNVSYAGITGPVANANPTGSPYAGPTPGVAQADVLPAALTAGLFGHSGLAAAAGVSPFQTAVLPTCFGGTDHLVAISSALSTLAGYGYGLPSSAAPAGHPGLTLGLAGPATAAAVAAAHAHHHHHHAHHAAHHAAAHHHHHHHGGGGAGPPGGVPLSVPSVPSAAASGTAVEINVPETLVGAILGKGGKTLVEYQEVTGARIQISKKGDFVPGTRNRRVTITGPPASTHAAQYLITQRLQYEQGLRAVNPQKVG